MDAVEMANITESDLVDFSLTSYGQKLLSPKPTGKKSESKFPYDTLQKASFGAGCFWGVEELFLQQLGVVATVVGYMGGNLVNPTYKDVCTGTTGHAEVIEIIFDLTIISYESLLEIFWKNHNPTTLNRQGPDIGTQYRSAIFFHNAQQQSLAELSKQFLKQEKKFRDPIVTEITAASEFYIAEEYHQRYLEKNGRSPCHI